ncbi:hypothetical protein D3C74_252100 [compost metagenome]
MLISTERMLLHLLQIIQERLVARRIIADCQRVDEDTYQTLQFRMRSSSNRRADYDIFLACVFMQERSVRRQQHHIQGCACLSRQFFQAFANFTLQSEFDRIPCRTLHRRTGKVG